jgi:hypothetical protein
VSTAANIDENVAASDGDAADLAIAAFQKHVIRRNIHAHKRRSGD